MAPTKTHWQGKEVISQGHQQRSRITLKELERSHIETSLDNPQ